MDLSGVTKTFGPWQRRVFIAFFYCNITGVWQNNGIIFLASYPKYYCIEPFVGLNDTCHVSNGSSLVPCTKWKYEGTHSIINQWDLVCDREWLVSLSKSVYMFGFLLAVFIFGQLSDIFGRFPTLFIGYFITAVSMFLTLLSTSYTMFLILRFFQALGRLGSQIVSYVLLLEITNVKHRTAVGVGYQISWTIGGCILPGIAWAVQDWFWLQLIMSLSFLPFALAYKIVPESPRWLLMKGKYEELDKTLKKAAAVNNKELDLELTEALKDTAEVEREKERKKKAETVLDLFKGPQLRKRILIMYFMWPAISFMYYALLFSTNDLAGDPYLNAFVSYAVEFVSFAAFFWGVRTFGRRPTLTTFTLGGAVTCLVQVITPQDNFILQISLWMVGKFFVKGAFGTLYLYTSELFPTVVRNAAVGTCSTSARIGSILAPFVKELGKATYDWVPTVLYGSLCLVGGLLALLLPETKGRDMPDTLQQGEDMSRPGDIPPHGHGKQQGRVWMPLQPRIYTITASVCSSGLTEESHPKNYDGKVANNLSCTEMKAFKFPQ